jgi:hypothetical protein
MRRYMPLLGLRLLLLPERAVPWRRSVAALPHRWLAHRNRSSGWAGHTRRLMSTGAQPARVAQAASVTPAGPAAARHVLRSLEYPPSRQWLHSLQWVHSLLSPDFPLSLHGRASVPALPLSLTLFGTHSRLSRIHPRHRAHGCSRGRVGRAGPSRTLPTLRTFR